MSASTQRYVSLLKTDLQSNDLLVHGGPLGLILHVAADREVSVSHELSEASECIFFLPRNLQAQVLFSLALSV